MLKNRKLIGLGLIIAGPLLMLICLVFGAVQLPISEVVSVLRFAIFGQLETAAELYPRTTAILIHIRLPRILAAILAGSALAVAGSATQGMFRNPLASPDILGISAGSSLGAVIAITTGFALAHPLMIPLASICGALITALAVYFLALRTLSSHQLLFVILAGLALSSFLTGAISAVLLMAQQYEISQFIFWTMGGLEGRLWGHVLWPAPALILLIIALIKQAKGLNLVAFGEDNAHGMGLNVKRIQHITLAGSSLLTALAISIAGPIGFIGLMVPHFVRLVIGPDHRILMPLSALFGAIFVLLADLAGRTLIAPHEIKVGIITALVGGSYFLFLILRIQKRGQL